LHTEAFLRREVTEAFTHRSFCTQKLLHRESFYTQKLVHTKAFTLSGKLSHRDAFAQKLRLQNWISTPKQEKDDFEALFKGNFRRKIASAKIEKIC